MTISDKTRFAKSVMAEMVSGRVLDEIVVLVPRSGQNGPMSDKHIGSTMQWCPEDSFAGESHETIQFPRIDVGPYKSVFRECTAGGL